MAISLCRLVGGTNDLLETVSFCQESRIVRSDCSNRILCQVHYQLNACYAPRSMDVSKTFVSNEVQNIGDRDSLRELELLHDRDDRPSVEKDFSIGEKAASVKHESALLTRTSVTRRTGEFAFGMTLYSAVAWLIDYPLYAAAVWFLGAYFGGLLMMAICLPIDLLALKAYDWSRRDWLSIEYCKVKLGEFKPSGFAGKIAQCIRNSPLWLRVLLLSLRFDPFLVTLMIRRRGRNAHGMTVEDRRVFLGSFLAGHFWWTFSVWAGLEGAQWLITEFL